MTSRSTRTRILTTTALAALVFAPGAASAQAPTPAGEGTAAQPALLDTVIVAVRKVLERAIDSLSSVSVVDSEGIGRTQPRRLSDVFTGMPGVTFNTNVDDPGTGFNVRGLQDFGRVAVVVDGARQNFQVSEHGPQGKVYLDPELVSQATVLKGPVANIYGSGAIGGVVSMSTKDTADILAPGDRIGFESTGHVGSNGGPQAFSTFLAGRPHENFDFAFGGVARTLADYVDGNGDTVVNSGSETQSGLGKVTLRPAEGHEVKLGVVALHTGFKSGEPDAAGAAPGSAGDHATYRNEVDGLTATGRYAFSRPDLPFLDLVLSGYFNRNEQRSVVEDALGVCPAPFPGFGCFTGPVGTTSGFAVETAGFDAHNNARFEGLGFNHTVTLGGDYFRDEVRSRSSSTAVDAGFRLTPSGEREVYGGFAEWTLERGTWLDVVAAARYDSYSLDGGTVSTGGDRISPKVTVGLTPLAPVTIYGTYAEGYRAPSVSEALVSGRHPGNIFRFLPNAALLPEIGHTLEAGVNVKYDGLFRPGDALRVKGAIFQNDVSDYIELQRITGAACPSLPPFGPNSCYGYVNLSEARIRGLELEASYDAGLWYAGLSGHHLESEDRSTGNPLNTVPPDMVAATLGYRFLDRTLTVGGRWQHVWEAAVINPATGLPSTAHDLVGAFVSWEPNRHLVASLALENLLDEQYTPFLQNNAAPGLSVKGSMKVRFGAK